jgi:hypothetical protein
MADNRIELIDYLCLPSLSSGAMPQIFPNNFSKESQENRKSLFLHLSRCGTMVAPIGRGGYRNYEYEFYNKKYQ